MPEPELTYLEIRMLELIAEGKTRYEIAQILHYEPHTVTDKITRLYRKIGVLGLLDPRRGACLYYASLCQY